MADFMQMKLVTIDMTNYKDKTGIRSFQDIMARNLTNTPFAVYLFEEIDKASIEVLDLLYFMMDEGVFYDAYQRPLFARGAFILMTTNAASEVILKDPENPQLRSLVMADLKQHFRASFLNRFDAISIFKPFSDTEFLQLANIMVDKKLAKIKENFEWSLQVDSATRQFIALYGRSPEFGARPMERMVEGTLGIGIAEYQLQFGAILEGAEAAITKLPQAKLFRLTVKTADGESNFVDYEVTTDINSLAWRRSPMGKFFQMIRLYND
jgi:ATP-dependent Clp protease ATP-binding subunit ClpA